MKLDYYIIKICQIFKRKNKKNELIYFNPRSLADKLKYYEGMGIYIDFENKYLTIDVNNNFLGITSNVSLLRLKCQITFLKLISCKLDPDYVIDKEIDRLLEKLRKRTEEIRNETRQK